MIDPIVKDPCSDCFVPYRVACNIQCPRVYKWVEQYRQDNHREGPELPKMPRPYEI